MATVDDPLERLQQYITLVEEAKDELDGAQSSFREHAEAFEKVEDAFENRVAVFNSHVDEFSQAFDANSDQAAAGVEQLAGLTQSLVSGALTQAGQTVEETEKQLTEAFHATKSELHEQFSQLSQGGFDFVETTTSGVDQLSDSLDDQTDEVFESLGGFVDEIGHEVDSTQSELTDTFHGALEEVTGNLTSTAEEAFSTFSSAVSDTATSDLTDGLSEVWDELSSAYDNFDEMAASVGEALIEAATNSLTEVGGHVVDSITSGISEAVGEAIEEFIQSLIADIIESIGMMATGAAVTGALSPIIPELAIAKTIVGTINDLLEMLNPF
jgi:chromosome segregation ATPase